MINHTRVVVPIASNESIQISGPLNILTNHLAREHIYDFPVLPSKKYAEKQAIYFYGSLYSRRKREFGIPTNKDNNDVGFIICQERSKFIPNA